MKLYNEGDRVAVWGERCDLAGTVVASVVMRRTALDEPQLVALVLLDEGFYNEARTVFTTILAVAYDSLDVLPDHDEDELRHWEPPIEDDGCCGACEGACKV